jgi:flagellar basal-body rod protein FlgB
VNAVDQALRFQESALKLSTQRQEVVGSNLANADTPKYKAQEFDFQAAMRRVQAGASSSQALTQTNAAHLAMTQRPVAQDDDVVTLSTQQPAADGNSVDVDAETAKFAESTVQVQSAFTFLNSSIKTILTALQS